MLGKVVAIGFTLTGSRGKASTPARIYYLDNKKEIQARRKYDKSEKEAQLMKKKKKTAVRAVPSVPAYTDLSPEEKEYYKDRANQEIPIKFYKVHAVSSEEPLIDFSSAPRSLYSLKQRALLSQNSSAFVKPGALQAVFSIFETHHGTYERALEYQRKVKNCHGKLAVVHVSWNNLLRNSWILSDRDVDDCGCMNPIPNKCCVCKTDKKVTLEYCDGSVFPGRGPSAFPCNRLVICKECRKKEGYRGAETWFCELCRNARPTFQSLYGSMICTPRDNETCRPVSRLLSTGAGKARERVSFVVRPLGAPVLDEGTNHNPALEYRAFLDEKEQQPPLSFEDDYKYRAATEFVNIFTEAAMSAGQQAIVMKGLNKLKALGFVKTDLSIFNKPERLHQRAQRGGYGDSFGSTPTTYMLDSSALMQGESHVAVVLLNPLHVIQRLLLKETIPEDAIYLGNGQMIRFDNAIDGERGAGGKVQMNAVFCERCLEFPKTDVKLALALATDKTVASGRTSFPLYWQLLNVDEAYALESSELAGFLPVCAIRKPHGADQKERLSRDQHEAHLQLSNDAIALAFKKLEEANRQGGVMMLFKDGRVRRVHFIVLSISEDIEGKVDDALVSANWCFRCLNLNSRFGSWMDQHACGEGPLGNRTPLKTFRTYLSLFFNYSVPGQLGATDERARSLGMKHFKVVNQLLAFDKCFGEKGVYSTMNYDDLHMLFLGLFVLLLSAANTLFCTYFKSTPFMQNHEDVHQWVEYFLALSPGMNDGVHILKQMKTGWFRLEAWNGVDNESFFSHLLFIFSTHDLLIRDLAIRTSFADIIRNVYSLYVRFKVKKYYRVNEISQLQEDIKNIFKSLQELFSLDVDHSLDPRDPESAFVFTETIVKARANVRNKRGKTRMTPSACEDDDDFDDEYAGHETDDEEPAPTFNVDENPSDEVSATLGGNQTRTHKCHMLTYVPKHIAHYGSLELGTTKHFENLHKLVKAWTHNSNRAKLGAVEAQVLNKSFTSRFDAAPKVVKSVRARLFREEHSTPRGFTSVEQCEENEEQDQEEGAPLEFLHTGTGMIIITLIT